MGFPTGGVRWFFVSALFVAILAYVLSKLYWTLVVPVTIGGFLCYLLAPVVSFLEDRWLKRRIIASALIVVSIFSVLGMAIWSLAPLVYTEGLEILKLVPQTVNNLVAKIEPLKIFLIDRGVVKAHVWDSFFNNLNIVEQIVDQAKNAVQQIWVSTPALLGGVIDILLIPLLTFFLLTELPRIRDGFVGLVPEKLLPGMIQYWRRVDRALRSVIKGQVMVAMILGMMYMGALGALGLKFGVAIGAIAGFCRLIPYLDVIVGAILSLIVIVSQDFGWGMIFGVGLTFLVVQLIDGMFITPRVIGERTGLHPGVVIVSVVAFGDTFGFYGVLVVIPILAVMKVSAQTLLEYYRRSPLFRF